MLRCHGYPQATRISAPIWSGGSFRSVTWGSARYERQTVTHFRHVWGIIELCLVKDSGSRYKHWSVHIDRQIDRCTVKDALKRTLWDGHNETDTMRRTQWDRHCETDTMRRTQWDGHNETDTMRQTQWDRHCETDTMRRTQWDGHNETDTVRRTLWDGHTETDTMRRTHWDRHYETDTTRQRYRRWPAAQARIESVCHFFDSMYKSSAPSRQQLSMRCNMVTHCETGKWLDCALTIPITRCTIRRRKYLHAYTFKRIHRCLCTCTLLRLTAFCSAWLSAPLLMASVRAFSVLLAVTLSAASICICIYVHTCV